MSSRSTHHCGDHSEQVLSSPLLRMIIPEGVRQSPLRHRMPCANQERGKSLRKAPFVGCFHLSASAITRFLLQVSPNLQGIPSSASLYVAAETEVKILAASSPRTLSSLLPTQPSSLVVTLLPQRSQIPTMLPTPVTYRSPIKHHHQLKWH